MSAGRFPLFSLIVCFLVRSSEAQKIIRPEKITAELGKNVILPCKVPNKYNIKNIVVEWSRPDLHPEYVLFHRDGHLDPENQHPSYQNRVDLQDKEMKDGDVSLIVKKVTKNDTGTYECRVFEEGKKYPISNISLEVYLSAQEKIKTDLGQDVILPCKVPNNNINIVVEWIRPDLEPDHVLFYRNGRLDPENQHPSYQNRVDLQDKEMKDGNASLILKNVKMEDTGTYACRVLEEGKYELISFTYLEVRPSGDQDKNIGDGGNMDEGEKRRFIVGPVVCVMLVVVLVGFSFVGFWCYRQHRRQNPNLPVLPDDEPAVEKMF